MKSNKLITKKIMIMTIILLTTNLISASSIYYNINLNSNNNQISIKTLDIELNQFPSTNFYNPNFNSQTLELIDFNNNIITTIDFSIPNIQIFDIIDNETGEIINGGTETLDELDFNLIIPYQENAKEIIIYNKTKQELTRISLAHFSKSSNAVHYLDNIPPTIKEIQEQEEIIKQQAEDETREAQPESDIGWNILLWILIILIIISVIRIFRSKKKTKLAVQKINNSK